MLKNLNYDAIHRLDLFRLPCSDEELRKYLDKIRSDGNGISDKEQWQVQEFITGQEYTAMAIVKCGTPVVLTMSLSSASHFNYEHIDMPCIRTWHQDFFSKQPDVHGLFTTAFQLHFAALVIGSDVVFRRRFEAWRVRGPGRDAVRLAVNLRKAYYGTILGGIGCWLIDMFLCEYIERALPFNPELHALWHIAAAGYVWCAALLALQLQWTDRGQHVTFMGRICGCIPVLRRRKTREE